MKRAVIATVFSSALLLGACSGPAAGEQLDGVLKNTFEAEKEYRETQGEMEKLEKEEQELFESIMSLTQEQQEEVKGHAEEAIASAEERLELLKAETASMDSAKENFKEIDTVIAETEDEAVKSDLEASKAKMQERFEAHAVFAEAYETLNAQQQELYEMLLDDEANLQELQKKALAVNEQNTAVQEAVEAFNTQTEEFNELKNKTIETIEKSEQ